MSFSIHQNTSSAFLCSFGNVASDTCRGPSALSIQRGICLSFALDVHYQDGKYQFEYGAMPDSPKALVFAIYRETEVEKELVFVSKAEDQMRYSPVLKGKVFWIRVFKSNDVLPIPPEHVSMTSCARAVSEQPARSVSPQVAASEDQPEPPTTSILRPIHSAIKAQGEILARLKAAFPIAPLTSSELEAISIQQQSHTHMADSLKTIAPDSSEVITLEENNKNIATITSTWAPLLKIVELVGADNLEEKLRKIQHQLESVATTELGWASTLNHLEDTTSAAYGENADAQPRFVFVAVNEDEKESKHSSREQPSDDEEDFVKLG
ncbi:hypothetical protein BC832DRAFT_147907 [Gaertneriomyces semiglobifer]|nr:hypothetical protein BC832DRAFT_147907 [Gaertneriomyces semiglobifer]